MPLPAFPVRVSFAVTHLCLPIASPAFFVAKKDGRLRMDIDYRKLNNITIKNAYPIPLIPELLNKWKGCVRFTKLDVRAGYHNIRIKSNNEWKTVFTTQNLSVACDALWSQQRSSHIPKHDE